MLLSPVFIVFAALLAVAAATDFLRQRIPNWLILALVALFALQALRHLHDISWVNQLGAGALCLLAGLVFFTFNQLGAGDAKLIAAVSLWCGLLALVPLLLLVSIAGVVFMGLLFGVRWLNESRSWDPERRLPKSLQAGEGIPYGVAVAIGTLLSVRFFPAWLWS